nr:immunoglobulin heavy chain junction region [Mus musculus]
CTIYYGGAMDYW